MKVSDELGIFWSTGEGHIEVAGIYFYGYWGTAALPDDAASLRNPWNRIDSEADTSKIDEADDGNFLILTVWIKTWPDDQLWHATVEETLTRMVALGARVAWCGGELCSWSLEELDPETSNGFVYAAMSNATGLLLHSPLSEEVSYLSDDEMRLLNSASKLV